jgi:hypothetical protein
LNRNEKLIYENERGQSIEFSVWSSFFPDKVNGLDGLKNIIYSSKSMGQDGQTFIDSTLDIRDITIQGTLTKDKDDNRQKLLSILNPKLSGKLTYINGSVKKYIRCIIDNAPIITEGIYNKFLVSFYCPNPYWYDEEFKMDIALWKGDFEFPLELTSSGIELGHREPSLIVNIMNTGDVEAGIRVEFNALGTVLNPSLFNVNTREFIKINKEMKAGEKIIITTGIGEKRIESLLNGITTNAMNYIDWQSTFLQLHVGDNLLRYNADKNLDNLEVTIYYIPQYVGA